MERVMEQPGGESALSHIKGRLDAGEGGADVHANFKRHYEHLEHLAKTLRTLGMDRREIDENIMQIFRQYERELVNYINKT